MAHWQAMDGTRSSVLAMNQLASILRRAIAEDHPFPSSVLDMDWDSAAALQGWFYATRWGRLAPADARSRLRVSGMMVTRTATEVPRNSGQPPGGRGGGLTCSRSCHPQASAGTRRSPGRSFPGRPVGLPAGLHLASTSAPPLLWGKQKRGTGTRPPYKNLHVFGDPWANLSGGSRVLYVGEGGLCLLCASARLAHATAGSDRATGSGRALTAAMRRTWQEAVGPPWFPGKEHLSGREPVLCAGSLAWTASAREA